MGVNGLWHDLDHEIVEFVDLCRKFSLEHSRSPRIALDMAQQLFHILGNKTGAGYGAEHKILIRRLCGFITAGADCVCVFDGPLMHKKHQKMVKRNLNCQFVAFAKATAEALGMEVVQAPAEAEAQCSHMQKSGYVDFVFSNDADVLCNGATRVIAYDMAHSSSTATSKKSYNRKVVVYSTEPSKCRQFIMRGLLCGNDWDPGVQGIGAVTAAKLASDKVDFAQRLISIISDCRSKGIKANESPEMAQWCKDLQAEAATNQSGLISKCNNFVIPATFPSETAVQALIYPEIESMAMRNPCQVSNVDYERLLSLYATDKPPVPRSKREKTGEVNDTGHTPEYELAVIVVPAMLSFQLRHSETSLPVQCFQQAWKSLTDGAHCYFKPVDSAFSSTNTTLFPISVQRLLKSKSIEIPEYLMSLSAPAVRWFHKETRHIPARATSTRSKRQSTPLIAKKNSTLDRYFSVSKRKPLKSSSLNSISSLPSPPWCSDTIPYLNDNAIVIDGDSEQADGDNDTDIDDEELDDIEVVEVVKIN